MQTFPSIWVLYVTRGDLIAGVFYHPNRAALDAKREELEKEQLGYGFAAVEYLRATADDVQA